MKSDTRTVLTANLSGSSSYSSGALDVGDLELLFISANTTALSGTNTFNVSSVDANGNLVVIATITAVINENNAVIVGNGSTYAVHGTNTGAPYFGDQIQIDLVTAGSISAEISIKGK